MILEYRDFDYVDRRELTPGEARELERMGFYLTYITWAKNGKNIYEVYVRRAA